MYKHVFNGNMIIDGKTYCPTNGILELPVRVDKLNPIEEENDDVVIVFDEKEELINKAYDLGIGAKSTLKRNSIDTLKKKIEEVE